MKFLYGLVLLVATLPLSAANPSADYLIVIQREGHNETDCNTTFIDNVWVEVEGCASEVGAISTLDYTGSIGRRDLSCFGYATHEICYIARGKNFCGATPSACERRRNLQSTDNVTDSETPEEMTLLEHDCLPKLQALANEPGNNCMGNSTMLNVTIWRYE